MILVDSEIDPNVLMTEKQTATMLAVKPSALQTWRHRGEGPVFVKVGQKYVRYRYKDLVKWIDQNIRQSTSG